MTTDDDKRGPKPHRPVDLEDLRRRVTAAQALLASLGPHLVDLHGLAYERHVGERLEGGKTAHDGHALTTVGDRRAKEALELLDNATVVVGRAVDACRNLMAGPGADDTLRGTLLGRSGGHHAAAELGQLRKAQSRRRERGEYVPVALEAQPELPSSKRAKARRKGKR